MSCSWKVALGWSAILLFAPPLAVAAPPDVQSLSKFADKVGRAAAATAEQFVAACDAHALTGKIDQALADHWAAAGIQPAPPTDDATFLRRVYLDLAGRIPSV